MAGASSGACMGHHLGHVWGLRQSQDIRCATCISDAFILTATFKQSYWSLVPPGQTINWQTFNSGGEGLLWPQKGIIWYSLYFINKNGVRWRKLCSASVLSCVLSCVLSSVLSCVSSNVLCSALSCVLCSVLSRLFSVNVRYVFSSKMNGLSEWSLWVCSECARGFSAQIHCHIL